MFPKPNTYIYLFVIYIYVEILSFYFWGSSNVLNTSFCKVVLFCTSTPSLWFFIERWQTRHWQGSTTLCKLPFKLLSNTKHKSKTLSLFSNTKHINSKTLSLISNTKHKSKTLSLFWNTKHKSKTLSLFSNTKHITSKTLFLFLDTSEVHSFICYMHQLIGRFVRLVEGNKPKETMGPLESNT